MNDAITFLLHAAKQLRELAQGTPEIADTLRRLADDLEATAATFGRSRRRVTRPDCSAGDAARRAGLDRRIELAAERFGHVGAVELDPDNDGCQSVAYRLEANWNGAVAIEELTHSAHASPSALRWKKR